MPADSPNGKRVEGRRFGDASGNPLLHFRQQMLMAGIDGIKNADTSW